MLPQGKGKARWMLHLLLAVLLAGPLVAAAQGGAAQSDAQLQVLEKLQSAHTLFSQRDYDAARKLYLDVLPAYPDNVDILERLAYCYYRLGNYEQAARYYQQAYQLSPSSLNILDKLADSLTRLRQYDEAARILRQMAGLPGAPAEAWKRAAEAYADGRRYPEAETAYDAYLQRNPGDLKARSDLGKLYIDKKEYPKAVEQFNLALSVNPNFSPAVIGMARARSRQGQHQEALQLYERALRVDPSDGEALTGKAFVLFWLGRDQEAKGLFIQLRRRYPQNSEVAQALQDVQARLDQQALEAARRTGEVAQVEAHYRERLAKNENEVEALRFLADATATAERCRESIEFGSRAIALAPGDADLELTLARSYALCERYDEAYAHFRRYVEVQEKAEKPLTELGGLMLRARRAPEAAEIFQTVLQLNPQSTEATIGLARARAAEGQYAEALAGYDAVLARSPDHYDALQGKAFILYWTKEYAGARPLFEHLAWRNPDDRANRDALEGITRAEEAARWEALRPTSDAPPEAFLAYYEKRLTAYPDDTSAMRGLAYNHSRLRNYSQAIEWYRKVLAADPTDRAAKMELARVLSFDRQYEASIVLYREMATETPENIDVLENLARVYLWAGQYQDTLDVYQNLSSRQPEHLGYRLGAIRMQMRLEDYAGARQGIASVLEQDAQNQEARLYLAQLEMLEGQRQEALRHYEAVLAQNPDDTEALYGKARIQYYNDDLNGAYQTASRLVELKPDSFDSVFLLANIENRRRKRASALGLLERAEQLSPDNPDVRVLTKRIREQPYLTVRTHSSFSREVTDTYDLRAESYGVTYGWEMLPKTDSYLSFDYAPTTLRTRYRTVTIPAGPSEFLYWQSTRVNRNLTVRAGVGAVVSSSGTANGDVIGLVGFSYAPNNKFSVDLDFRRSSVNYTPESTLIGVMRNRWGVGFNFFFDPRTRLSVDYQFARYKADRSDFDPGPTHEQAHITGIRFIRNVYGSDRASLDLGYEATFMDFGGRDFLGVFDPDFYQTHEGIAVFKVTLFDPVDFGLAGSFGTRQRHTVDSFGQEVKPIRRGGSVNPSFTIRVHRRLIVTVRYTYYNTAQVLDAFALPGAREDLVGNVFSVTTDWKF